MPSVIPPATNSKKRIATHTPEAGNTEYIKLEATPDVEVHTVPTSRQAAAKRKTKTKTAPIPNGRRNHTGGKKWTGADLEALFAAVLVLGDGPTMRSLEGKVEGRTAKQCYDTWKGTVAPYLVRCLREHGGEVKSEVKRDSRRW